MSEEGFRSGASAEAATSVPIDHISDAVELALGNVQRTEQGISFATGYGHTYIDVIPVRRRTNDGFEVEAVVKTRTEFTNQNLPLEDEAFALFNAFASFGALMRDPDSGRIIVGSRLTAYAGDSDIWRLHMRLVAFGSILQGDTLISGMVKTLGGQVAPIALADWDKPCLWGREDFEGAAGYFNQRRFLASGSDGGMTVEFPWEPGAMSAMAGHQTSLMQFRSDTPHPILGNGLFFRLDLPVQLEADRLPKMAKLLNQYEWAAIDAPPFFGA